jgi:hypothetical protein
MSNTLSFHTLCTIGAVSVSWRSLRYDVGRGVTLYEIRRCKRFDAVSDMVFYMKWRESTSPRAASEAPIIPQEHRTTNSILPQTLPCHEHRRPTNHIISQTLSFHKLCTIVAMPDSWSCLLYDAVRGVTLYVIRRCEWFDDVSDMVLCMKWWESTSPRAESEAPIIPQRHRTTNSIVPQTLSSHERCRTTNNIIS